MGYTIPPPAPSAADHARALISQKDNIEAEIGAQSSILSANGCTLRSPLVDADGFPRADIDIYAVRTARVRIIELRNDLDVVMAQIARALEGVYDPAAPQPQPQPDSEPSHRGAGRRAVRKGGWGRTWRPCCRCRPAQGRSLRELWRADPPRVCGGLDTAAGGRRDGARKCMPSYPSNGVCGTLTSGTAEYCDQGSAR
ncbi:hypothetical protein BD779DRAFT_733632 [Infundibulicybe gibba]|nr:hypothetical protein BD779DRAFT_733632 [Infundibulicybe gibba]